MAKWMRVALAGLLVCLSASSLSAQKGVMRKGPYLIYEGVNTEMKVVWQLSTVDTCIINWGSDTTYSSGSDTTTEITSDHIHTYTIGGLDPGDIYYYEVVVDAFKSINSECDAMDPVQHIVTKDGTLINGYCDNDVIGTSEGIPDFIM